MSEPIRDAKVAIVGSRKFSDYAKLCDVMKRYKEKFGVSFVVSGGAEGADTLAERWAKENEISYTVFVAKWQQDGKQAGTRRNLLIVECCDVVIAFPTAESKGTRHTIDLAKRMGKPVYVFES